MHEAPKNFKRKRYLNEEKEQQTNQTERLHRWQKSHRSPVPNVKIGFNFTHEPIETVQRHVRSWNSHCSPLCTFGHWAYDDHDHVVCDSYIASWFLFIPCLRLDFCLSFLPFTVFRTVFFFRKEISNIFAIVFTMYLVHSLIGLTWFSPLNSTKLSMLFSCSYEYIVCHFDVVDVHVLSCRWQASQPVKHTTELEHFFNTFEYGSDSFFFASRCSFPIHLIFAPNSPANKVGWVLSWTDLNPWFKRVPNILFSFLF